MPRTLVALCCALALAGGSALAQQPSSDGASLTDKAKSAARALGEKTKEAAEKVKSAVDQQAARTGGAARDPRQMQQEADAEYKSAKARCQGMQQKLQKTLCEKEAAAAHAEAEVEVAKANLATQGGNTATMGAGKSSR